MVNSMSRGMLAAFAASALAIVTLVLLASSASAANTISLSAAPATIAPGDNTVVTVNLAPESGVKIAGIELFISYDETKLTAASCTPASTCNVAFGAGQVKVANFNADGLPAAGSATVTFTAKAGTSGSTAIGLTIADAGCQNDLAEVLTCTATGTTINIGVATATPTTAPSATASATVTPAAPPATGGNPGDSSSVSTLVLVLAAASMMIVGAGAWVVARPRPIR